MPRLSINQVPSLRRHVASGQGVLTLNGHDHYLGKWPVESKNPPPAIKANYERHVAEWLANGRRPRPPAVADSGTAGLTIGQLIVRFWPHVERHYRRPDGSPTGEADNFRLALRPLRAMYEQLTANEFSPLKLQAVREAMIGAGLCRTNINARVARIRRMFRWGVAQELVAESVYNALATVAGLQLGRCDAKESEPVGPVSDADFEATLPHLHATAAAMVRLMRSTGMRVGEVVAMRPCDVDVSGPVWVYSLGLRHKTAHRGKRRTVAIGPRGREVLGPFLSAAAGPEVPVFSPQRAMADLAVVLRASRKAPVQPSQRSRKKARRKRPPGLWYTPHAVAVAVRRACGRADRLARQKSEDAKAAAEGRAPARAAKHVSDAERLVPGWHVHQLRHRHADEVQQHFGLEGARAALGHSGASITELYLARDQELAARVAAKVG